MKFFDTTNPFEDANKEMQDDIHCWLPFANLLTKYNLNSVELNGLLTEIRDSDKFKELLAGLPELAQANKEDMASQLRGNALIKAAYFDLLYKLAVIILDQVVNEVKPTV